jgi:hypothetical protein
MTVVPGSGKVVQVEVAPGMWAFSRRLRGTMCTGW